MAAVKAIKLQSWLSKNLSLLYYWQKQPDQIRLIGLMVDKLCLSVSAHNNKVRLPHLLFNLEAAIQDRASENACVSFT
jgi:hypothetical protein